MSDEPISDALLTQGLTRRELLARGGAAGVALGLGPYLAENAWAVEAAKPKRGGRATVAINTPNLSMNPVTTSAQVDFFLIWQMYRGLTFYDAQEGDYVLDMADDVDVSGDKTTYKLKKGILFHDGGELTAKDVRFSVAAKLDPKNKSFHAGWYPTDLQMRVVDKYTIQFITKQGVLLPSALAQAPGAIFPERAWKTINKKPVGTGPFKYVSRVQGQYTLLKRNPNYYKSGLPYLDQVRIQAIPEGSSRVAALLSGQVQVIDQVPMEQLNSLKKNKRLKLYVFRSTWIDWLILNNRQPPFDNVKSRQAVVYACDRKAIADVVAFGQGGPQDTLVPARAPVRPTNVRALQYDPERAKQLVKETGLDKIQLEIQTVPGDFPTWGRATELIAAQCNKVGMNVKVSGMDFGTWIQRTILQHDFTMSFCGSIAGLDADSRTFAWLHSKGANQIPGYNGGKQFDAWLVAQRQEPNVAKRVALLNKIWNQALRDNPWYFPYWVPGAQATAKNIAGYRTQPEMYPFMDTVYYT